MSRPTRTVTRDRKPATGDRPGITGVMEDYLKAIYRLQQNVHGPVATSRLAQALRVAPATTTVMVQRLARTRLVSYHRYRGVTLTAAGERIALETIRHHRLIELYLAQHLGIRLESVHGEAEKMEHVLSDDVELRMAAALGNPTTDPHGDPIPSAEGALREVRYPNLTAFSAGETGTVARVSDRDPAALHRLAVLGVLPGVRLKILRQRPSGCSVEINGRRVTLPRALCDDVYIQ
jgi:DtxR family transcriptional regulator, Mn-dependent transcriptional regulator